MILGKRCVYGSAQKHTPIDILRCFAPKQERPDVSMAIFKESNQVEKV